MVLVAKIALASTIVFILLVGCAIQDDSQNTPEQNNLQNLKQNCCQECLAAANRDPSGYDISIKPCFEYDLSSSCLEYSSDTSLLVMDCQTIENGN